jgi:hypothetical protein
MTWVVRSCDITCIEKDDRRSPPERLCRVASFTSRCRAPGQVIASGDGRGTDFYGSCRLRSSSVPA